MTSYTNPSVRTGVPPFDPPTQVFPDDAVHTEPFHLSTFELLYLMNCEHYDEELTTAIDASSERNRALYGSLVFLHGQRRQLLENVTRMDQHMGMLAQHITDDETFTVTGAIAVPRPSLDIANLPLHVVLPDTDPNGDRFTTDDDVNPNNPAFLRKVIAHRRGLKRATEVSKGQHLLQLRQRCIGATPIPSSSLPQTNTAGHVDASTKLRSPTPVAGVSSLPANQRTLLYPDLFPVVDNSRSSDSNVSNASRRAGKFPDVSPPTTPPAMSTSHELAPSTASTTEPSSSTFQRARLSPELLNPICLPSPVIPINPDTQRPYRISDPITHTTELLDKVQEELNVLCANWESTAPSTVWTMSAQFATLLKLAISLDIVGTEEGL
uniref:Uncharacterized protein n=1 Tax=Moniliophthora roreri TaxID=221103 RepID=A0A0W0FNE3_MONRR